MRSRTVLRTLLAVLVALVAITPTAHAAPAYQTVTSVDLGLGVTWDQVRAGSPELFIQTSHLAPDAAVKLVPVLSNDQVAETAPATRTETTSSMCRRAKGLVCVNADFTLCKNCGQPFGAFVLDGVPRRSQNEFHEQFTILDDGSITTDKLRMEITIVGIDDGGGPLEEVQGDGPGEVSLTLDGLNRATADGIVLYSPNWASHTQTGGDAVETVFRGAVPAIGDDTVVVGRTTRGANSSIPGDGFVVSATGDARQRWNDFRAQLGASDRIVLRVRANLPARMSVGGHPIVLKDGKRVAWDTSDSKIRNRHPRTLLGWNDAGDRWLVTVDGRQPGHSIGVTMAEAADYLEHLGATDAVNFDGGGSSTFVTARPCSNGASPCVRNLPSDGRERRVSTAIAVVAVDRPPPPPPPPPPPADPSPVATPAATGAAQPAEPAAPATTAPTTPAAPAATPVTVPEAPAADDAPATEVDAGAFPDPLSGGAGRPFDVALPEIDLTPVAPDPTERSRTWPALLAVMGIAGAGVATHRVRRLGSTAPA